MVLAEMQYAVPAAARPMARRQRKQVADDDIGGPQLGMPPRAERVIEHLETFREETARGLEDPFELQVRFLVEANLVDAIEVDAGVVQAPLDRLDRKRCIVL